ncbi:MULTISPECIES: helix-turn-helix domain-containing protein [unclassified Streptomyces]|uniref:helix-turn-helix domain-containing protein n=1 Tax=unclassified Streptomyces TaxID=2593676 RepID=UPI0036E44EB7
MAEADGTAEFAARLRGLKERSGLSYGVLAKRLHMSTSTLHRYCNGDAVPVDYAPVERLARLCKAAPEELVELHRLWVLADAARRTKPAATAVEPAAVAVEPAAVAVEPVAPVPVPDVEPVPSPAPERVVNPAAPEPVPAPPSPKRRRSRRAVVLAAALAVVVAGGAGAFAVHFANDGSREGGGRKDRSGAASSVTPGARSADPSGKASPSAGHQRKPSAGPSRSDAPDDGAPGAPSAPAADEGDTGIPLTVATTPYVYESPCSQHFLIDRPPAQVPPPPLEQDAPTWVGALGAVASGEQLIKLTVQGTGSDTVVLEDMDVRVMKSGAPLAWNDYSMGVGCGGNVDTKSFGVDLDAPRPVSAPKNGQRDFPYKVSESDPEVFYVKANAKAHDVSWVLELKWSSGSRHGVLKVDDQGRAFRTSADVGRPGYDYPIGAGSWGERVDG